MSASIIWIGIAVVGIIIDLLLQYFLSSRKTVNIIEVIIVLAAVVLLKTLMIY